MRRLAFFDRKTARDGLQREDALTVLSRLLTAAASLLRGGIPPARVWEVLGEEHPLALPIARRVRAGVPQHVALVRQAEVAQEQHPHWLRSKSGRERVSVPALQHNFGGRQLGEAWRMLAAVWALAESLGVPLAPVLERFAAGVDAVAAVRGRRRELLAAPFATVRLLLALPFVCFGGAALFGIPVWQAVRQPAVTCALLAGLLLLLCAFVVARRMFARAAAGELVAGFTAELVWVGVRGGLAPACALRLALACCVAFGVRWVAVGDFVRDAVVPRACATALSSGVPVGELLLAAAREERRKVAEDLTVAAERLGVRMLVPVGCFVLPAFILLGVLPVAVALLTQ